MCRPKINNAAIDKIVERFRETLAAQIEKKGRAGWVSSHETLGGVIEEIDEFKAAVHTNDREAAKHELMHVMIAACWGLASETEGGWDW